MRRLRALFIRIAGLFRKHRRERELAAEMESHLQLHIEDNLRSRMSPVEARRQALIKLGGLEQTKEAWRDRKGLPAIETLLRDFRYAGRVLRKNPGFTFVVVFTLALGIGANTAIFSVLESQLWRPLPFPDSERLVDAHVVLRKDPRQWDVITNSISRAWAEQNHSFSSLGAYNSPSSRNLTAGGTSERVRVMELTSSLFKTLNVPLERGRIFLPEGETTGRHHVAILSHALWQTRFASDTNVIGKPITIDGETYFVVGITSPRLRFEYLPEPAIYVPLTLDPRAKVMRGIYMIGRLAPGVSVDAARAELDGILQRQSQTDGAKQEDIAAVSNLRVTWTEYSARGLYFFAGAILLVLLIACVNNAGLLLARGLSRQREFALRATLGASRATLIRQSLAESLLLSLAGGAAGTLLGVWGAGSFPAFLSQEALPRHTEYLFDWRVLLFVLGVSIFSALLMGIVPALFSSRVDVTDALRKGTSGLSASRSQHRTRSVLVAVEVALALVLLFGAGLFLSSFLREEQAPRGFDAQGALTFRILLRGENYAQPEQQNRYFRALIDQLRSLPGVQDVTMGSSVPLQGSELTDSVNVEGQPLRGEYGTGVMVYAVEPNFFDVLHMHLLAGRALNPRDTETSPRVAIINRNAAHTLLGSEDPLGKVLDYVADERRGAPAEAPVQIVGVTENTQEFGPNEVPFDVLYVPFSQQPDRGATIVVSSSLPRGALLGAIRDAACSLDKDQPLYDVKTVDQLIGDSLRGSQFDLILVSCLAVVALALVSVGIFGTVAYFVQLRTQEFGIRFALGATPAHVLRQAIARTYVMGLAGLLCGVAVALAIGRILGSSLYLVPQEHDGMLYSVRIYDPLSMSFACVLLLVVLFLASFIPARRAARVDPMVALRYE
ncbi:MAG TPA: ABC transporter permease [Candidatus Acidoferrum sp.]|nr:ABC transporter permease [Candidatus Acidoferrum sp.]